MRSKHTNQILAWVILIPVIMPATASARLCLDYSLHSETNPATPRAGMVFPEAILDVDVLASHAYMVTESGNLRIAELSNPAAPFEVANYSLGAGPAQRVAVFGCQAYIGHGNRLRIVDITSANDPYEIDTKAFAATILDVAVTDNLLAITLADSSIIFFHAPNCGSPLLTASLTLDRTYDCLAIQAGRVYLGGAGRITVIEAMNPDQPDITGGIDVPGAVNSLSAWGDTLAGITADALLLLKPISGADPQLLATTSLPGPGLAIEAVNRQLHITSTDGNWWVYHPDYQQFREPVGWGLLPAPGLQITSDETSVFVADGSAGLQVVWLQCLIDPPTAVGESRNPVLNLEAFPNPGNPRFTFRIELPQAVPATLTIIDLAGRVVAQLPVDGSSGGFRKVIWNGTDRHERPVASGVYTVLLQAAGSRITRRIVLAR